MDGKIDAVGGIEGTLNVSTENCVLHGEISSSGKLTGTIRIPEIVYITKENENE